MRFILCGIAYLYLWTCLIKQTFKKCMGSILVLQTTNPRIHQYIVTKYMCYPWQSTETIEVPF